MQCKMKKIPKIFSVFSLCNLKRTFTNDVRIFLRFLNVFYHCVYDFHITFEVSTDVVCE